MKKLAIAITAVAALTGSAFAADMPVKAYVAAPPARTTWTGCYVGAGGGYGMWNQENTLIIDGVAVPTGSVTNGGRGWFGTGQVGCDYQVAPQWVIGAFGDYDFASIKGNIGNYTDIISAEEKLSSSWAAGARVGYLPWEKLLVFMSGGYSQAHFNQIDFADSSFAGPVNIPSHTYHGWFLGSGYEYKLDWMQGLSWKTEYRFYDYGSNTNPINFPDGDWTGVSLDSHKYAQTIRSELVWRFWSY